LAYRGEAGRGRRSVPAGLRVEMCGWWRFRELKDALVTELQE